MQRIIHWYRAWRCIRKMRKDKSPKNYLNPNNLVTTIEALRKQAGLPKPRAKNWNKFGFRHFNWRYFMRTKYGYALDVVYLSCDLTHRTVDKQP